MNGKCNYNNFSIYDPKHIKKAQSVLNYWHTIEFMTQDKYDPMWEIQKKAKQAKELYRRGIINNKTLWDYVERHVSPDPYKLVSEEAVSCGMKKWGNITVYIGRAKREACIEYIARKIPENEAAKRCEQSYDEIAWASLQLAPDGTYIEHSLSLSTVIWAMSQIRSGEQLSSCIDEKKYENTVQTLEEEFLGKDAPARSVHGETLQKLSSAIEGKFIKCSIGRVGKESYQENYGLYFQLFLNEDIKEKKEDNNYTGLSHGYFLSDIQLVSKALDEGKICKELLQYIDILGEEDKFQPIRIDLITPKAQGKEGFLRQIAQILEVRNAPLGKWPSRYMPALMQQIAVNLGTKKGETGLFQVNGTIFSVNGPPGTGKTTLLKEIVAGNIVERAALLAQYEEPDSAFNRHRFLCGEGQDNAYYKYVRYWNSLKDDKINDYGILVASCNNAAVENVTKELPVSSKIQDALAGAKGDSQELQESLAEIQNLFDAEKSAEKERIEGNRENEIYFTKYAKALLKSEDIWGLVAAPLGRRSNLSDFYYNVLYPLHRDFYKRNTDIDSRLEKYQRIREAILRQMEKVRKMQNGLQKICDLSWFRLETIEKDRAFQKEKKQLEMDWNVVQNELDMQGWELEQKHADLKACLEETLRAKEEAEFALKNQERRAEEQLTKKREYLEKEVELRDSIGILDRLFKKSTCAAKERLADEYCQQAEKTEDEYERMLKEMEKIRADLAWRETECDEILLAAQKIEGEIKRGKEEYKKLEQKRMSLRRQAEESAQKVQMAERIYGSALEAFSGEYSMDTGVVLDETFADALLSEEEETSALAHITNPWFTERYNREREKLFFFAMKLNKEFVLASRRCRDNLITLSQYWGMKPDENNKRIIFAKEDREAFAASLYQTLFLVVPVVSSTFASIGTFLRDIKQPRSLGTLIVDEAGQAQPQMAVGALFRCRKAMIVGDPKQVEPVVTDDLEFLKKTFDHDEIRPYRSKDLSVQNFADKMNGFGTYLDNGTDYPEWVGCPLLVHRRCISPMYDISNEISYNGIMKQQTRQPDLKKSETFVFDRSQWINVVGEEHGHKDHFVENQGGKVCEILEKAFSKTAHPDMFIISPFTSVVRGIKKYIKNYDGAHPGSRLSQCKAEWMNSHIGTVHTFQGKEAAEVIFILGCDKSREAAGAVRWVNANIVNVAATRAKYRLYVVGDEAVWRNSEVVNRAKNIINSFAIRQIKNIIEQDIPESEKKKALADASCTLPPVTAFHTEISEVEGGVREYNIDTEGMLSALPPEFSEIPLSEDQLRTFGFESGEMMDRLPKQIRDNLCMGIRLYYLLRKVYEVNHQLDVSCCSILFCKAIELQMKECFGSSLRKLFPDYEMTKGNTLGKVDVNKLTLGNFYRIIKAKSDELSEKMKEAGELRYDVQWWKQYGERVEQCTRQRNNCCHSGLFTWEAQKILIQEIFLTRHQGKGKQDAPDMKGVLFEAEVGKRL